MGFQSGPHGIKRQVTEGPGTQHGHRAASLEQALLELGLLPDQTCVIIDSDIIFMGGSDSIGNWERWADMLALCVLAKLRGASVVVFCFDNPAKVPHEKAATQQKRSAQAKKRRLDESSSDPPFPTTDDYDNGTGAPPVEVLASFANCRPLVQERGTRRRLMDQVVMRVVELLRENNPDHDSMQLIFDGIDPRGGARPVGEERQPSRIYLSSKLRDIVEPFFADQPTPPTQPTQPTQLLDVGESDLKLSVMEDAIRAVNGDGGLNVRYILRDTRDTDEIAIMLCDVARRRDRRSRQGAKAIDDGIVHSYLVSRETGKFAREQLEHTNQMRVDAGSPPHLCELPGHPNDAGVLLLDMEGVQACIEKSMREHSVDVSRQTPWTNFLVAAWTLTGTDYSPSVWTKRLELLERAAWTVGENAGSLRCFEWYDHADQADRDMSRRRAFKILSDTLRLALELAGAEGAGGKGSKGKKKTKETKAFGGSGDRPPLTPDQNFGIERALFLNSYWGRSPHF